MVNGKEEVVEEVVIESRMFGRRTEGEKGGGEAERQPSNVEEATEAHCG